MGTLITVMVIVVSTQSADAFTSQTENNAQQQDFEGIASLASSRCDIAQTQPPYGTTKPVQLRLGSITEIQLRNEGNRYFLSAIASSLGEVNSIELETCRYELIPQGSTSSTSITKQESAIWEINISVADGAADPPVVALKASPVEE